MDGWMELNSGQSSGTYIGICVAQSTADSSVGAMGLICLIFNSHLITLTYLQCETKSCNICITWLLNTAACLMIPYGKHL